MDPHRSKRLVYTTFNAEQHDELMWVIHNDPVSWTNACAQIQRPMDRTFHTDILRHKSCQLLFVIINTAASDLEKQHTSGQAPTNKLNPIGQLVLAASDSTMVQHCETTLSIGIHKDYQRQVMEPKRLTGLSTGLSTTPTCTGLGSPSMAGMLQRWKCIRRLGFVKRVENERASSYVESTGTKF